MTQTQRSPQTDVSPRTPGSPGTSDAWNSPGPMGKAGGSRRRFLGFAAGGIRVSSSPSDATRTWSSAWPIQRPSGRRRSNSTAAWRPTCAAANSARPAAARARSSVARRFFEPDDFSLERAGPLDQRGLVGTRFRDQPHLCFGVLARRLQAGLHRVEPPLGVALLALVQHNRGG